MKKASLGSAATAASNSFSAGIEVASPKSITFEKMAEGFGLGRNLGFTLVAKWRFGRPS